MPSKIRVLSDHTINKIAAGEVIENPSSVVKELVENSLDANATDIGIEIQGGGRQMIRISDNGCGMNADDALLCLERHATSKLREVEEIHSLLTMGFRGEAIPSIASISKFNLLTCPIPENNQASPGTMVIVDGGKIVSCSPAARSPGTTIEVKNLFFNVPVRKKFLKSPSVDTNEILKTVSLIALGYPEIKFQLISDGKNLLMAPPSNGATFEETLCSRIENVLGQDFSQNMTFIEGQKEDIVLRGFIGEASYSRHNRTGQYLFINKRVVTSPLVAYAVKEGFGTALPTGRFPVFVLHLSVSGELVDVNVHPQKREVRLRQEQLIKELIIKTVRNSLNRGHSFLNEVPAGNISPVFAEAFKSQEPPSFHSIPETWVFQPSPPTLNSHASNFSHFEETKETSYSPFKTQEIPFKENVLPTQLTPPSEISFSFSPLKEAPPKALMTISNYILLDAHNSHSFIEKGCRQPEKEGLILIDQKNAHARILFEKLSESQSLPIIQQTLLIPHTIELSSYESENLRNALSSLNKMGIHIKEFGPNTFLVDAIPQIFGNSHIEQLIADIIHELRSSQHEHSSELVAMQKQAKHIALAATRSSISLHKRLSLLEAQSLIDQLVTCKQPYLCPSGKPILAQLSLEDLAKLFQR